MAVSAKWYGSAAKNQFGPTAAQRVDWVDDTIRVALLDHNYAPAQDTDQFLADVQAHEVVGTGYTAGGVALANKVLAYAAKVVKLTADLVQWNAASFTARYAVIYKDTGSAATSPLLGYVDFGSDESVASGNFAIQWDPAGILTVTVS